MRLGCRAALWPAPGRRQMSADSPSQRGSGPAHQSRSNSASPARQGAKRENRIRSAPRAIRQRRRRRVFVASRSIAFGEFDVGPSDQQRPEACTRRQPPLLRQQLPRCDRARLASQEHDEQGGYNKQRHAQAGDHGDRHLCIQPLDSQGPEQTLE